MITDEVKFHTESKYLNHCSCPDPAKLCKHIFLVSRITNLPFTLRVSPLPSVPAPLTPIPTAPTNTADTSDTTRSDALPCEEYVDDTEKYLSMYNSIVKTKIRKFKKNPEDFDQLLSQVKRDCYH